MIKTFLMAMTCLTSTVLCAQNNDSFGFSKGNFTISGGLSLSTGKYETQPGSVDFDQTDREEKQFYYQFEPSVSYFISDHFAVGARLGVGQSKSKSENRFEMTSDILRYGAFGNYYFTPKKRFSMSLGLGIDVEEMNRVSEFSNDPDFDTRSTSDQTTISAGFSAGFNYFLSSRFALHGRMGLLSYNSSKLEDNTGGVLRQNRFLLNTQLQNINLGLLYRI